MSETFDNLDCFARWLSRLEREGKDDYNLVATIPDGPGQTILLLKDLRELVRRLNANKGAT